MLLLRKRCAFPAAGCALGSPCVECVDRWASFSPVAAYARVIDHVRGATPRRLLSVNWHATINVGRFVCDATIESFNLLNDPIPVSSNSRPPLRAVRHSDDCPTQLLLANSIPYIVTQTWAVFSANTGGAKRERECC